MLPGHLRGSYEQYKADSDFCAGWLLNTAQACGYVSRFATTGASKVSRPKGKARQKMREADSGKTYHVDVAEFVPLAECIARFNGPSIVVPKAFTYRLQRAIQKRKAHQKWHQAQGNVTSTSQVQDGHGYFIRILESVQTILQSNVARTHDTGNSASPTTSTEDISLINMFGGLAIEEPEELCDDQLIHNIKTTHVVYNDSDNHAREESLFAQFCLSGDMHYIRREVSVIWHQYSEGKLDLVAASITTNTAIDFVRSLQSNFESTFPGHSGLTGKTCIFCPYELDNSAQESASNDISKFCLQAVHKTLLSYTRSYFSRPENSAMAVSEASMEIYPQRTSRRTSMSLFERGLEDYRILQGVLPEFQFLLHDNAGPQQAEHEILRGLRLTTQEKQQQDQNEPILWFEFAIQLYLDIRHILGKDVDCGFTDLMRGGEAIMHDIKHFLAFHTYSDMTDNTKHTTEKLKEVLELVGRWVGQDYIKVQRLVRQEREGGSVRMPEHYLLKRDPIWCGLLLYNFRVVAYQGAIISANCWLSILSVAHMYNCLQQESMLTSKWADMDHVISMQGASTLFVGDPPRSMKDYATNLTLALGFSPTNFASNRRNATQARYSQRDIRRLKTQTPISWLFKHRYCENSGRTDFKPTDVEQVLTQSSEGTRGSRDESNNICHVLQRLSSALHAEAEEMIFDYFELHMTCWSVLRCLERELKHHFDDWIHEVFQEYELPFIVYWILSEESRNPKMLGANGSGRLLRQAAGIMDSRLISKEKAVTGKRKRRSAVSIVEKLKRRQRREGTA